MLISTTLLFYKNWYLVNMYRCGFLVISYLSTTTWRQTHGIEHNHCTISYQYWL